MIATQGKLTPPSCAIRGVMEELVVWPIVGDHLRDVIERPEIVPPPVCG